MTHRPIRRIVLTGTEPLTLAECACGRTGDLAWLSRHMREQDREATA